MCKITEPVFLNEVEILKRYSIMEKHFQRCKGKSYFPSLNFYLNYYDDPITSLKEEAENMLCFAGLGTYSVKLNVEKLKDAAGLIKLTADMYAEITLDIDVYKDVNKSMATLAHEICHKILYAHGLYYQFPFLIENEIFADLATFYVGFGTFTMKGYSIFDTTLTSTSVTTQEKKYGYLTSETYGLAYHLMNVINGITEDGNYKELPDHAKLEIEKAKKRAFLKNVSYSNISTYFLTASQALASIKLYIDNTINLLDENNRVLQQRFKELSNGFYGHSGENDFEWHKISLAYQYVLNSDKSSKEYKDLSCFKGGLTLALDVLAEKGLIKKTNESEFEIIRMCPICGEKIGMKLENKSYHFICPKCKFHFVVNNNNGDVLISLSQSKNKRNNDSKELLKLRGEVKELTNKIEAIEKKWWYKLFKRI